MAKASRAAAPAKKTAAAKKMPAQKGMTAKAAPAKKSAASKSSGSEETKLKELFVDELKDIYYAEKLLLKTMPKLAKAATSQELKAAYQQHMTETEGQIARLEQVFGILGLPVRSKKCEAMEGLTKEGTQAIEDTDKGTATRDAALIISSQKAEHYEIASYGSLVQLAKTMGHNDVAQLLGQTLAEEKSTDEKLSRLAESSINVRAEAEPQ
ncbi:YciE/YciF ferroxidase family protein [Pseudocnuella soli]|uniref:YciE/YciF ferroxidase family protein n=1 Tax=Pseudocnuella soli TaxID=2502779 RepID=UPI001F012EF6|nr:ferritin-like domain-containing protein [Pseudocnuella soli]